MAKNVNKLPVVSNTTISNASPMKISEDKDHEARERKYRAEEALSVLERAEEHKRDKVLMKDVKALAKNKIKCLDKLK